jgi:hypothetical protein
MYTNITPSNGVLHISHPTRLPPKKKGQRWTESEDEKLREGEAMYRHVNQNDQKWRRVSEGFLGGSRNSTMCRQRFRLLLKKQTIVHTYPDQIFETEVRDNDQNQTVIELSVQTAKLDNKSQTISALQERIAVLEEKVAELHAIRLVDEGVREMQSAEVLATQPRMVTRSGSQTQEVTGVRDELADMATWAAGIQYMKQPSLTSRKYVELRPSLTHGTGLWSSNGFKKGDRILEYEGELVNFVEYKRREKIYEKATLCSYFFELDTQRVIDATRHRNLARYINHAAHPVEPNAYAGD